MARVQESHIDADGALTISALSQQKIDADVAAASAAASIAAGFGGVAGVAVSGAGADSTNTILFNTEAYVRNSSLDGSNDINIKAINSSFIEAVVVAAAFSLAIGGKAGIGSSVGAVRALAMDGLYLAETAGDLRRGQRPWDRGGLFRRRNRVRHHRHRLARAGSRARPASAIRRAELRQSGAASVRRDGAD